MMDLGSLFLFFSLCPTLSLGSRALVSFNESFGIGDGKRRELNFAGWSNFCSKSKHCARIFKDSLDEVRWKLIELDKKVALITYNSINKPQ